jgi:hypothetical protein
MPGFSTEIPHALGKEKATARLKGFVEQARQRFGQQVTAMEGSWNESVLDFSLTAMGMTITGTLAVEEGLARVAGKLPLAAMPFRGRIEESIAEEVRKELA